jgi:hypothetical protein
VVYFVIDSVQKLLDIPSYTSTMTRPRAGTIGAQLPPGTGNPPATAPRKAPELTQSPIQRSLEAPSPRTERPVSEPTTHFNPVPRPRIRGATPPYPPHVHRELARFRAKQRTHLHGVSQKYCWMPLWDFPRNKPRGTTN